MVLLTCLIPLKLNQRPVRNERDCRWEWLHFQRNIEEAPVPLDLWFAFVAASAVLLIIPGPTTLTVISYSVSHGRGATLPLIAAVALGDSTALLISLLGLGALLATSAAWFTAVKWVGGSYLLYLGAMRLRAGMSTTEPTASNLPRSSRGRLFVNTYLVTTLNPKGIVFYVAFLPQFVNPASSISQQLWILAVTFVTLGIVNVTLYATFAGSARRLLASPRAQRRFNIAGGSMLFGAGVWTLLAKRSA